MSSFPNQPVVEDIVSAFETTQNQPWSLFNNKLGGIPIKDCKKSYKFKSENPIELTDEDIPVFGLVPRLEKLMLISCNKCSMVVKRDCIHYHYDRRHNDPENDDFSLESFILQNNKTNKHKKQKISVRKLPEKKIIDDNTDLAVQEIKTEFDLLEFERLTDVKIKQENEIQYIDDFNENLIIENCNPSTSCGVFNWNLKTSTQSLSHFIDQKVSNEIRECDKDLNEVCPILPSVREEPPSNTHIDSKDDGNMINCGTNSNEISTKSISSNKKIKPKIRIDFSGIFSGDDDDDDDEDNEEFEHNEIYDDSKNKYNLLPFGLKNRKEQTKFTTNLTYSNLMSDQSSIALKEATSCKNQSDINNKYTSTFNQSTIGNDGKTKCIPTNNSNLADNLKYKINDDSENVISQLNTGSHSNKDQTSFISSYKSSTSLNTKDKIEITQNYSNVVNDEKIEECKEQIIFSPTNKNLDSMSDTSSSGSGASYHLSTKSANLKKDIKHAHQPDFFNVMSDQENESNETQTTFSSSSHSSTEENQYTQSNEYTAVMSNESSDNDVTSNDESSLSSIELPLAEEYLSDTVDNDYSQNNSDNEYFQLSSGYDTAALMSLSQDFNYNSASESDEEIDNLKKTKLMPSNEYSVDINTESSGDNNTDQLSASSLYNNCHVNNFENKFHQISSKYLDKPKFTCTPKYSDILSINSENSNNSEICDQYSNTSSDIEDEESKYMNADSYSDCTNEDSSNDSDNSNEQSITELQDFTKNTKSTQTNLFLINHLKHKQFVDPITRIDESIAESLGVMNDENKCIQTNVSFDCDDCLEITEDLTDNYFPFISYVEVGDANNSYTSDKSRVQIPEYSMNSFTPISSSAQIINNTIIPTSAHEYNLINNDYSDNNVSNDYDVSSSQKYFQNPESQCDHSSSRLVQQNPIIENNHLLENNKKNYSSKLYADRHKHTENILLRNAIMMGSAPYMNKNHAISRDRLKKAIGDKIIYSKNCMKIPYEYNNIEAKIKKSLKRRLGGKVADGKENHTTWMSGSFKKLKRIEFVTRKNTYSDESDNNDKGDE